MCPIHVVGSIKTRQSAGQARSSARKIANRMRRDEERTLAAQLSGLTVTQYLQQCAQEKERERIAKILATKLAAERAEKEYKNRHRGWY